MASQLDRLRDVLFDPHWRRRAGGGYRLEAEYLQGTPEWFAEVFQQGSQWTGVVVDRSKKEPQVIELQILVQTARQAKESATRVLVERLNTDLTHRLTRRVQGPRR